MGLPRPPGPERAPGKGLPGEKVPANQRPLLEFPLTFSHVPFHTLPEKTQTHTHTHSLTHTHTHTHTPHTHTHTTHTLHGCHFSRHSCSAALFRQTIRDVLRRT